MIFKKGEQGISYYKDGQARVASLAGEILPMRRRTPMKLMVEALLKATPKEAKEEAPKTTPGTVKERPARAKRSHDHDGPMDLSWAEHGSLSLMSKKHRKEGLWALDTCSANAWPGAKRYPEKTQADFVAVQEAKLAKAECADAEQIARNSGWRTATGPCSITATYGKSAGLPLVDEHTLA